MRIYSGVQNHLFHTYQMNQSVNKQNQGDAGIKKSAGKDTVMISLQGRNNNRIQSLMKQKMDIMEQKETLMSSATKDGRSMEMIKSQLESYDKQLENIDKQIADAMAEDIKKQEEKLKEQKNSKPKTKEEIQNQKLADIANLSNGLKQAETVEGVQSRVDGEARVSESEIELDRMHDPLGEVSAEKEKKLSELKEKSAELMAVVGKKVSETAENIKKNSEISIAEEEADEEANEETDEDFTNICP